MSAPPPRWLSRYRIETWGCQMNEHDSEKLAGVLSARGMSPAPTEEDADVILLNTCAIREKASQKVFGRLGRLRKIKAGRPGLVIGVCGCVAQMEQAEIFRRAPHVDFVIGPRNVGSLPELLEQARARRHQLAVIDPRDRILPEAPEVAVRSSRAKAYVTIMEGCNMGCAFCVVPATRGRESCRAPEAILEEAGRAAAAGFLEIELLGQTVNAYRSAGWDFTRLLAAVSRVPGIRRLRYTTSHPLHLRDSVSDLMGACDVICSALHLPVQSGSDAILAAMRRGYSREEYIRRVDRLRRRVPAIALSTDIIVGFPGESEEDFSRSMSLLSEVGFEQVYAFVYSPRPGTPAEHWEDGVPFETKNERLQRLLDLQKQIARRFNESYVGRVEEVLVEGPSALDRQSLTGRTRTNRVVNFEGPAFWTGSMVDVRITRACANSLRGEPARPPRP